MLLDMPLLIWLQGDLDNQIAERNQYISALRQAEMGITLHLFTIYVRKEITSNQRKSISSVHKVFVRTKFELEQTDRTASFCSYMLNVAVQNVKILL